MSLSKFLVVASLLLGLVDPPESSVASTSAKSLMGIYGGDCVDCMPPKDDAYCDGTGEDAPPPCQPSKSGSFCLKTTYHDIVVMFCSPILQGSGYKGCETHSPAACVTQNTCSTCNGGQCTNCGPDSVEEKPTDCTTIPYDTCEVGA